MIWISLYVSIGCAIALVSLSYTKAEELRPPAFLLAHAFWPASLLLVMLEAILSSRRDESQNGGPASSASPPDHE